VSGKTFYQVSREMETGTNIETALTTDVPHLNCVYLTRPAEQALQVSLPLCNIDTLCSQKVSVWVKATGVHLGWTEPRWPVGSPQRRRSINNLPKPITEPN